MHLKKTALNMDNHGNIDECSEDDQIQLSSNNNNDCNLLLNDKKNPDSSIFDDSYLAMVSCRRE